MVKSPTRRNDMTLLVFISVACDIAVPNQIFENPQRAKPSHDLVIRVVWESAHINILRYFQILVITFCGGCY